MMKFNPTTQELFTNRKQLIKILACSFDLDWNTFDAESGSENSRSCSLCSHSVLDTASVDGATLLKIVAENPNICLKLNLDQHNIKIINNGVG